MHASRSIPCVFHGKARFPLPPSRWSSASVSSVFFNTMLRPRITSLAGPLGPLRFCDTSIACSVSLSLLPSSPSHHRQFPWSYVPLWLTAESLEPVWRIPLGLLLLGSPSRAILLFRPSILSPMTPFVVLVARLVATTVCHSRSHAGSQSGC